MATSTRYISNAPKGNIAPLIYFRGAFGFLMLVSLVRFYLNGWVDQLFIQPDFFFNYYGFEWIPRLDALGVKILFTLCAVSTIGIALGWMYRLSAIVFFITFSYFELYDAANYLNHYYFVSLAAFVLIFLPAHKAVSLDVFFKKVRPTASTNLWNIHMIQLMVGGLYLMAGIAKINYDWLFEAMPMRLWLPPHNGLPIIGTLMDEAWMAFAFSWMGMFYDLTIPFFLLWKKTRKLAFAAVVIFHGLTAILFPIGMFPYMMIAFSLVFFPSSFLEKIVTLNRRLHLPKFSSSSNKSAFSKWGTPVLVTFVIFFVFVFPFRYQLYPGKLFWHEQGYRFSWRVMLMEKSGHAFFYVKDPQQPGEVEVNLSDYLTPNQVKQMCTQPDFILQFAHHLEEIYQQLGIEAPQVRVKSWVTLNGSGAQLFIDPNRDLTKIEDSWAHKDWVIPFDQSITLQEHTNGNWISEK